MDQRKSTHVQQSGSICHQLSLTANELPIAAESETGCTSLGAQPHRPLGVNAGCSAQGRVPSRVALAAATCHLKYSSFS